jgi:hypothetical protein
MPASLSSQWRHWWAGSLLIEAIGWAIFCLSAVLAVVMFSIIKLFYQTDRIHHEVDSNSQFEIVSPIYHRLKPMAEIQKLLMEMKLLNR